MINSAKRIGLLLAIGATIGCDRITKHVAETALAGMPSRSFLADTLRLQYVENTGGFLSLGADLPSGVRIAVFTIATGVVLVALIGAAIKFRWSGTRLIGLALFVTGGASNWMDRVARGSVTDFLNVGIGPVRTGVFNVADMAIMFGAAVFGISQFHRRKS